MGPYQVILLRDLDQQGAASTVAGQDEVDLLWGPQLDSAEHREPAVQHTDLSRLQVHQHRPAGLLAALPFQCYGETGLGQLGPFRATKPEAHQEEGQLRLELHQGLHSSLPLPGY